MTPTPGAGTSAPGIDPEQLIVRVTSSAQRWSPRTIMRELSEIGRGSSGLTFHAVLGHPTDPDRPVIIKVAPSGLEPVRNRDVLRQADIQRRLGTGSAVPVPEILFQDAGKPPAVPPFYTMTEVPGVCFEPLIDEIDELPTPAELDAWARDAARTLAALHRVRPDDLGLENEPVVDLLQELRRWARMFDVAGIELGGLPEKCLRALEDSVPDAIAPCVVHGDFRLGNQICGGGSVRALIDWEIWTRSDPRIDVSWFLMTMDSHGLPSAVRQSAPGLPTVPELLSEYEIAAGRSVVDLAWFCALARLRSAGAMALNVKHNRRRPNPSARIERYSSILVDYLQSALTILAGDQGASSTGRES